MLLAVQAEGCSVVLANDPGVLIEHADQIVHLGADGAHAIRPGGTGPEVGGEPTGPAA